MSTPDPKRIASLLRAVGLTSKDLQLSGADKYHSNDRIMAVHMQDGPMLVPQMQDPDLLTEWLLVYPHGCDIETNWEQHWIDVIDALDDNDDDPQYEGVHGQMTQREYRQHLENTQGIANFTRESIVESRHRAFELQGRPNESFADFIKDDPWLGGLRAIDQRDPQTGQKLDEAPSN